MHKIENVLFDLDGTMLDTVQDLGNALNSMRRHRNMADLPLDVIRPYAGVGAKALLKIAFGVDDAAAEYKEMLEEFFNAYQSRMTETTALFPGMEKVLQHLEQNEIPWGIVTNKPTRFTIDLLDVLDLSRRTPCVICGDTLPKRKPHPEPILEACRILNRKPEHTLYVGDTLTDVTASKAAGTRSLVVLYGYIGPEENPYHWQADGYVETADEIINWI